MKILTAMLICLFFAASTAAEARGGYYAGGHGSSHKGGSYKNARTGDHYENRK